MQTVLIKILSTNFHHYTILKILFLFTGFFLLFFVITSHTIIDWFRFIPSFSVSLIINILAYSLLVKAILFSPISKVMPYIGFTPLFLIFSGWIILGEKIGSIQIMGIFLIVLGGFIIQLPEISFRKAKDRKQKHLSVYLKESMGNFLNTKEKGILLAILVAFLWSITASVEKIAVLSSSPKFYGGIIHLSLGLSFLTLELLRKYGQKKRKIAEPRSIWKGKKGLYFLLL